MKIYPAEAEVRDVWDKLNFVLTFLSDKQGE